jgi:hypothetical protein
MRTLIFAALAALLPVTAPVVPGGKACQVADSAVPTPGLEALVFGSKAESAPTEQRLTGKQIEKLADLDTEIRRTLQDVDARAARLPAATKSVASPEISSKPLAELVEHFLSEAARDHALLIDVEGAREFHLANADALAAKLRGDETRWCALCLAVRRGMEADFAWKAGEFGALSSEQQREAVKLASLRNDVRRKWTAALKAELSKSQLSWLRESQMRWLKTTLHDAVASGMRTLGAKKCESCATARQWKCEFCSIVLAAVEEAKKTSQG